jgi:hypothetical protein
VIVGVASSREGVWFVGGVGMACVAVCIVVGAELVGGVTLWSRRVLPDWREPGERCRATWIQYHDKEKNVRKDV